jgi:hypothetical protein
MDSNGKRHLTVMHPTIDDLFYYLTPKDYSVFMQNVKLATTYRQQELLAAQSCQGHAMNGDLEFAEKSNGDVIHHRYPNVTISDVYQAIIQDSPMFAQDIDDVHKERLLLIKELKGWITEVIDNIRYHKPFKSYKPRKLQDKYGKPLMGIELFNHTSISKPESVLTGIFLGSYMDSEYWRARTESYFADEHGIELKLHRGLCTAGNLRKIIDEGYSIHDLARVSSHNIDAADGDGILKFFMDKGMVVDFSHEPKKLRKYGVKNEKPYVPVFVEISKGFGLSDDAAFNYASLIYGLEAGLGLILIDAVDTIDKCVSYIKEKGEDELLGDYITSELGGMQCVSKYLGIHEKDIMNLIFAAAIDAENPGPWPSCSQRRFLEYQKGDYALLSHIDHIKYIRDGTAYPDRVNLSIKNISNDKFYGAFLNRMRQMDKIGVLPKERIHHAKNVEYLLQAT